MTVVPNKYRNKLTEEIVDAIQFRDLEEGVTTAELILEWTIEKGGYLKRFEGGDKLMIHTLNGWLTILKNDYVLLDLEDRDFFVYSNNVFESLYDSADPVEESGLVAHARRELTLLGEDPDTIAGYLKVIQAFADMGHSGGSASVAIPVLNELLQHKNLRPLTDDPEEWFFHDEGIWGEKGGIWQNMRRSEAFSKDGGKTYYLLSEHGDSDSGRPIHTSVTK